jgi:hypothetical protein
MNGTFYTAADCMSAHVYTFLFRDRQSLSHHFCLEVPSLLHVKVAGSVGYFLPAWGTTTLGALAAIQAKDPRKNKYGTL